MKNKSEHKLQYKVHTQTGSSVITITLTETNESKQTVEKFIQTLDAEVTEMLKRKLVKFEKIGGENESGGGRNLDVFIHTTRQNNKDRLF